MGSKLAEIQPRETQVYMDLDREGLNDGRGLASHRIFLEFERVLKELGRKVTEDSLVLLPKLLSFLKHDDPFVVKRSITSGTSLFCAVLVEIAVQLNKSDRPERWLEKMWSWMLQFKDAVFGIVLEPGSVGTKVLAVKFLETCVLTLTSDEHVGDAPYEEGKERDFNVSWLKKDHPVFNPAALAIEANNSLKLLLDLLRSADSLQGSLTIAIMNCLATIARKRPLHYDGILAALLAFTPNDHTLKGGHVASVRYSLRTAFLGFLKCNHPSAIESRDKLVRWLRSISPGEAVEQVIRQVEKMSRMERMSRDVQVNKDDELSGQISTSKDSARIWSGTQFDDISSISEEMPQKKMRFSSTYISIQPVDKPSDMMDTPDSASDFPLKDDLSPVEKMIAMIGALLAEGERGSESLEILISNIHADLLADIVLETMKHLPKNSLSSSGINGNSRVSSQMSPRGSLSHEGPSSGTVHGQPPISSQNESTKSVSSEITMPTLDMPALSNILADFKRDPRRDPRRFDPRLAVATTVQSLPLNSEKDSDSKIDLYQSKSNLISSLEDKAACPLSSFASKDEDKLLDSTVDSNTNQLSSNEALEVKDTVMEVESLTEAQIPLKSPISTMHAVELELSVSVPSDATVSQSIDDNPLEPDQYSSPVSTTLTSEDASHDLPMLPVYVELTTEQKKELSKLAIARIFKDCKKVCAVATGQPWLPLLARLVAQSDADGDMVSLLQSHIISDCDRLKGHELTMLVLYHIHAIMISESNESSNIAASNYEKFLLSSAKGLIDSFSASDKSFSRLLGEAPFLPDSALRFLEDVCYSSVYDHLKKDAFDGDRATQGLGTLWSLILSRPSNRLACLEIALKCAVHAKEEVRTKAVRLVVNKLYILQYASEHIESFAKKMLLSVVNHQVSEAESQCTSSSGQRTEVCNHESSFGGSQNSENGASESETMRDNPGYSQNVVLMSSSQAQQKTSLFFALCSKKPSLFKLIFDIYGRAPKAVKQAIHRHVPILLRNVGESSNELQHIISNPPEGCENLITLVLQVITEESTADADLITAVKHLYETRMKDAAILIPILSSLSKDEVLPIFPRLVDLSIEKFQAALACILQGSAHTGPALTPVEVLNAIHDINPDKDGVALKKITDACTACFEQRTVFTQQVLEKSLNSLVDRVPLPLLLMRTVIQTIDAFPIMVEFMMGILSRLVSRQIWRMPKLWVGFLKCASQTMPHSFNVLLQLPTPQLEGALNKYPEMRIPLASFANQPNNRSLLSRQTLGILGLSPEQ
ncbi:uncharacterized protein LOC110105937 [Dendrobium catenatum]|uniref:uncharacterized protein LOC110105937 n=1 Tax=Dendrobium catenatum TaxID=906689 RepID=UPI0009F72475|nr:uncharacterized protein LOC110105937 [Dendrobium catenatum]